MTPNERASACFLATAGNRPLIWFSNGVSFRADDIALTANGDGITATLTAWTGQGANASYLPVDNPYTIINPPTLVPDGTTSVVVTYPRGSRTITKGTFRSDPLDALRMALADAVLTVARRSGWNG